MSPESQNEPATNCRNPNFFPAAKKVKTIWSKLNSKPMHLNLPLAEADEEDESLSSLRQSFASDGFVKLPGVLSSDAVDALNRRLEHVLRGTYDRGDKPDKTPKLIKLRMATQYDDGGDEKKDEHDTTQQQRNRKTKSGGGKIGPLGFTGSRQNAKVLQVINVHKCDRLFRQLATNASLGRMVAKLAGWKHGARLAQDQVWAKPPGSPPLTYHRDSPYFMFAPSAVVTVWVAFDDMVEELGPLVYVRGSHKWGEGRVGSAGTFFQRDGGVSLLRSAAEREGLVEEDVKFVSMEGLLAGGISIHDGRCWHGSGSNRSECNPRRGLGLHFVPAEVRFTADAAKSRLYRSYVEPCIESGQNIGDIELPEEDFPIVWTPDM